METLNADQLKRKGKKSSIYCRMDDVMINQLFALSEKTGISVSEILRESVRRLLEDANILGEVNLTI